MSLTLLYRIIRIHCCSKFIHLILKKDRSKTDTFGAFCRLSSTIDYASELTDWYRHKGLAYHGMKLAENWTQSYKSGIGKRLKSCLNFSSTFRNREKARRISRKDSFHS